MQTYGHWNFEPQSFVIPKEDANTSDIEEISKQYDDKVKFLEEELSKLKEQQEIVHILDNLLENKQRAKELCDTIEEIDLMKKGILAKTFRGELGTNNPEEESDVELFKEVLKEKVQ